MTNKSNKNNIEYIRIRKDNINDIILFLNERGCNVSIDNIYTINDYCYININTKYIYKFDDVIIYHIDTKQFEISSFDEYVSKYYNQVDYIKNHKPIIIMQDNDNYNKNNIIDKYQFEYKIEDEFAQKNM